MSTIERMADRLLRQVDVDSQAKSAGQLVVDDTEDGKRIARNGGRRCHVDLAMLAEAGYLTSSGEQTGRVEEYRRIKRPLLMNAFGPGNPRSARCNLVMITSALPGEGKSYTAINLAMSISMEFDTTVLLVDSDVVRSSVTKTFGLEGAVGLTDVLLEPGLDLGDAIYNTDMGQLRVLPAGRKRVNFTELFASAKMKRITEELSDRYPDRIVLFDTPPLLATTQASVLASLVGQLLFVVEAERTPQQAVKEAIAMVGPGKIIGTVLNKSRQVSRNGYYGDYY